MLLLHSLGPAVLAVHATALIERVGALDASMRWRGVEVLGLLGRTRIIYVESFCRVEHLSMTGKLLYATRITDSFLVQWEGLAAQLPRAECIGRLV